ncbi:MAG: pyruvate dehydrogenase complex dihydrolipoamide acetyltransferase [Rickettsiaceae bacterium]|nr:MAG: pyruvate dehydrogenase complex dihydrolipoamide acetyltransferase [Rickettsiaceae bacterium]
MPIKIMMPALSPTMTEGNLTRWLKKEGDNITSGEVIAEIETDKATMEVEAADEGILAKIIVNAGTENVPVNSLIAIILEEDEDIKIVDDFCNSILQDDNNSHLIETNPDTEENNLTIQHEEQKTDRKIFISPLARKIAQLEKINISNIVGTGPHGRIIKADLLTANSIVTVEEVKINDTSANIVANSNLRKTIAKRLIQSKQSIPHFYLSIECNFDQLIKIRTEINDLISHDNSQKLSLNDFIILAVSKSLRDVPQANSSWNENNIVYYHDIDISVAVAIEGGLITPIIKKADQKSLVQISTEMKQLAKKAKENKLTLAEFQGGSFSISNLGMYGIKKFSAIINPPQSCILAIGANSKRPVIIDDKISIANIADITLSCDHRVVDGVIGANFLAAFKKYIEQPTLMLIN